MTIAKRRFLLAGIALNLAPGPDTFCILVRSGAEGRAAGVAFALRIADGSGDEVLGDTDRRG